MFSHLGEFHISVFAHVTKVFLIKDEVVFFPGGIASSHRRKMRFWGTRYRSEVGQLFSQRYDPMGCTPGVGRAEKYLYTCRHTLEKIAENADFCSKLDTDVPDVRKSCLGCADHQNLLIHPITPQNIHILSTASLEQIYDSAKMGPKHHFSL